MRHVVVTGAAGGLGAATSRRLADEGWSVVAADLPGDALDRIGAYRRVTPQPLDVTSADSVAELAEAALIVGAGRLDAVVNFAGVLEVGPMAEMPEEVLRRLLDINVLGTFRVNQALFPMLVRARGRIVNISSETGWQSGGPFNGAYGMSKHAIEAYSDSLRREAMLVGVKVVKVQPGPFRTGMVDSIRPRFEAAAQRSTWFAAALRRVGELGAGEEGKAHDPQELADVIVRALTAARPRAAYSVHPDRSRVALEWLPTSWADRAVKLVLTRGGTGSAH